MHGKRHLLRAVLAAALASPAAYAQAPSQGSGATIIQSPASPPGAPARPQTARPTLVPQPGDPSNVDEVVLPERDVLVLSGSSTWEDGLKNVRAAIGRIEVELAKAGVDPAGRPLCVFTNTADDDFRFDAMVPVARSPDPGVVLPEGMRWAKTPSGKAYRFAHKAAYEEIDQTYETITTYLDAKDIVAKDAFIEEYVNDVTDPADTALEVNIYVQPK